MSNHEICAHEIKWFHSKAKKFFNINFGVLNMFFIKKNLSLIEGKFIFLSLG